MQLTDDLLMPLPEALHESSAQNEWDALKNSSSICQQTIQSQWQSFLLRLFTHETEEVFKTLRLSFEEQVKFDDVLKEIENCTFPRFLIIYNRFKLFTHEKEKDDTCEAYALQLKRLSQYCEFGEDSNGVLAKHIAKALNMNYRYTDFPSILEACRKQDKASSQSDCEGPTMPSDTCQLENLSATHVRKRKIPVHTNVHPVAEIEAKSKQVSELSDYTNQRPKRKISVPARLQTDAVAMKLLKFTERRAVVEREKCKTMYEGKGHSIKQKQIKQKPTSSKVMTQDARNGCVGKEKLEMSEDPERGHDRKVKSPRVDEQYICTQCGGSFESKLALNRHLSLHKTEKRFTCRICLTGFASLKSLVDHKKVHAYSKSFKCEMCGKTFNHLVNLKCHLSVHTGEKPYQCPHCDQKFTWQAAKRRHVRLHTGERPYPCEFCPKRFIDFSGWQNHTRTHTKEKPLTCNLCSFQTSTSALMAVHRRTHSGERPYQCKLCTKAFISSANLTVHMKSHHGRSRKSHYGRSKSKNVVCEVCGKRFQCPSNLKLHSRKHSGEKPYKCSTCGAMFGWYAAFKRHQRTHTKEKPYTCDICHRSFADKPYLSRHKLSHTGERPFKCEVCGKTFVVSHDLQDHVKIHSSDRKFVCEVCGMAFVRKCYLYKHKRVHFGIKTHQCETCGKKFFEPNKLRDHMQRHEKRKLKPPPGSKHHLCSTCGKVFAKKAYLVKHIMTHTGNKPYICDTCGAKFVDSFKLKRHKNIHNRRSRTSVPGKINSAEILALEQLGIQILTESASQGSQEQSKTVITAKEESLGQVTNNSISTQHIIVQQNEEDQKLEVPAVESQNNEQQQIIITQPETSELNQVMTDQPYEVIILEVW